MQLQLPTRTGDIPAVVYTFSLAGIVAATIVSYKLFKYHQLDGIPTVGSSGWFGSWRAGHKFKATAHNLIQEGYRKYKSLPFKIADSYRWLVIVSSRQHIEELRKAPDNALSFLEGINDSLKLDHTVGPEISNGKYQTEFIRTQLSIRHLGNVYSEIQEEVLAAFDDALDLRDNEWKSVPALSTVQQIVCRVSNRIFVGLPLCRHPDWIDINLRFTMDIVQAGNKINRFPSFLAPIVVRFMTDVPDCKERAVKLLAPIIEERLKLLEEHETNRPSDKPIDFLSWLLEEVPEGVERTVKSLTTRVLAINVVAIHTSSGSFAHALFFLAENPQYIQPLREEVETIVETEGWSKASLSKMRKIDSFLRESQRIIGLNSLSLERLAVKDFTFSDGTFIPKGTTVAVPLESLHLSDAHYEHPYVFNPFRFSNMGDKGGEETKHRFVSTSLEYLPFGHGKHACPGRFFASDELKFMLAHMVVTYDVKLEDNKPRPEVVRVGTSIVPNPFANVMLRRRTN